MAARRPILISSEESPRRPSSPDVLSEEGPGSESVLSEEGPCSDSDATLNWLPSSPPPSTQPPSPHQPANLPLQSPTTPQHPPDLALKPAHIAPPAEPLSLEPALASAKSDHLQTWNFFLGHLHFGAEEEEVDSSMVSTRSMSKSAEATASGRSMRSMQVPTQRSRSTSPTTRKPAKCIVHIVEDSETEIDEKGLLKDAPPPPPPSPTCNRLRSHDLHNLEDWNT